MQVFNAFYIKSVKICVHSVRKFFLNGVNLWFLIFLLFFSSGGFTTETRIAALGRISGYFRDDVDIYTFAGCLTDYPRLGIIEYGVSGGHLPDSGSVGIFYTNSKEQPYGVFGLILHRKPSGFNNFRDYIRNFNLNVPYWSDLRFDTLNTVNGLPETKFDFFWAKNFGTATFGVHLENAGASWTHEIEDTSSVHGGADSIRTDEWEKSTGILGIGFGAGIKPNEKINLDFGFAYRKYSFDSKYTLSCPDIINVPEQGRWEIKDDGGRGINFWLRAFYPMTDKFKFVPLFKFESMKFAYKYTGRGVAFTCKGSQFISQFDGGLGLNYTPSENALLVLATTILSGKTETKNTIGTVTAQSEIATFILPGIYLAGEISLTHWLTLRMGACKLLFRTTNKPVFTGSTTKNDTTYSSSAMNFAFGLGFKFGNLCIDTKINEELPFNLAYIMSGNQGNPVSRVSVSYKF